MPAQELTELWNEAWQRVFARFSRRHVLIVLIVANILYSVAFVLIEGSLARDWRVLERAAATAGTAALYQYDAQTTYVWSPVAAYPLKLLVPLGVTLGRALLIGAALALPTWRLRAFVLVSIPFWADISTGNVTILVFVASIWALRGSRIGTLAFFALALLIPRPLLVPTALWILWKRPAWRLPVAIMFVAHAALVWWTGLGVTWAETAIRIGPELLPNLSNLSPSRFVGLWWLVLGIPLGAWFFFRGRLGWAGLAVSPYIWPYYLYWLLPEANSPRANRAHPSLESVWNEGNPHAPLKRRDTGAW